MDWNDYHRRQDEWRKLVNCYFPIRHRLAVAIEATEIERFRVAQEKVEVCIEYLERYIAS